MSELADLLLAEVAAQSRDDDVAILLSGGLDSLTVALAFSRLAKRLHAYTYQIKGYPSEDCAKARAIARHFGWPIEVITIDTASIIPDFKRLAVEHDCKRKVQFECTYVLLHVLPRIREREVLTGYNADEYFGNTKNAILEQARLKREGISRADRKRIFDAEVEAHVAKLRDPNSGDTWWYAHRLAAHYGKRLLDPYLATTVREYFGRFDHEQLSSPKKPLVREAFSEDLAGLPVSAIAVGVKLQKGGGVHLLFETLLKNPDINRFDRKYTTISALCQRWGKEVTRERSQFECRAILSAPAIPYSISYEPYILEKVKDASRAAIFNVLVTFAGGGGSSIGYQLAGGRVLVANEFVPEAARTYRRNFPNCLVDERDIRAILSAPGGVQALLAVIGLQAGDPDVQDGSPPCSEFSIAGKGIGDQNVMRSYSDVKQNNIASLPFDFVELAHRALPKVVICENVPAFATRGREVFLRVLEALKFPSGDGSSRRYFVNWAILSANDFGVAQKRRRLFIIGVRNDVGRSIGIQGDDAVATVFPRPTSSGVTIRSALAGLEQKSFDVLPWISSVRSTGLASLVRRLPRNPARLTRLSDVIPGYDKQFTLTRTAWDLPAPTLTVTGQQPSGLAGAIHPEEDRKFTIPELKRLTGLPDDFILTGTLSQAAERICRMVPPPLTKAIAESIYKRVLRPFAEKSQ